MNGLKPWYIIVNPKAGNGKGLKKWPQIKTCLEQNNFKFEYCFTSAKGDDKIVVENAIARGFSKFICVGGDGTLHHIVNGIMSQEHINSSEVSVGIIPIGTGNDWVKTYGIPNNIEQAISTIKNDNTKRQDIGKISFLDSKKNPVFYMNLAGIGFDAYVANKVEKLKKLGALSYLVAALKGLFKFKNFDIILKTETEGITSKSLMVLVGICKFSGGGMRLTNNHVSNDGLFDITIVGSITKWQIVKNLHKLYNGKVATVKTVKTLKSAVLEINLKDSKSLSLQADGEVFNAENIKVEIVKNAFCFYC